MSLKITAFLSSSIAMFIGYATLAPEISHADITGNEPYFLGETFEGSEKIIFSYDNEPSSDTAEESQRARILKRSVEEYRELLTRAGVDLRLVTFLPPVMERFRARETDETYTNVRNDEPLGRAWKFSWRIQHPIILNENAIKRAPGYQRELRPFNSVTLYRIRVSYGSQLIHNLDAYTSKRDIHHDLRFLSNETWHGEPSLSKLPLTGEFKELTEQRAQMARDNQYYINGFKGPMKVYYHPDILKIEVELLNSDGLRVALIPIASGSRAQSYLFNGTFWWMNPRALTHHCRGLTRPKASTPTAP